MTTDPTITIAGLTAEREALILSLRASIDHGATSEEVRLIAAAELASAKAERDALAAQLAKVRAELAAAPKVCSIHSYEHGPGPCMTCGAWPPGTRELIATCQGRIAGLEQAADERSKEVARLTDRVAELEARPVLTAERLTSAVYLSRGIPIDIAAEAAKAILAVLGPVTLPAQDAAERMAAAYCDAQREIGGKEWLGWSRVASGSSEVRDLIVESMRRALASLGAPPTSTPAARPVFAGVSEDELIRLFYVVGTDGIDHGEQCPPIDSSDRNGIRAVLARLQVSLVAPVDPEAVAKEYHDCEDGPPDVPTWIATSSHGRATSAMRATLTAAGIPVTPEVGK